MLQLWRTRPSCQRVSAAPPAQKVPFLSEYFPHGGQLSAQSTATAAAAAKSQLSGNSYLTEGWGRWAKLGHPLWNLSLNDWGTQWGFFSLEHCWQKATSGFIYWTAKMGVFNVVLMWSIVSMECWQTCPLRRLSSVLFVCVVFLPWISVLALEWNNHIVGPAVK